jgi:HK97 family phage major capsid protein
MSKISEIQDQKNKLIADATVLVQRGLNTPEQKEEYRKVLAATDETQEHLDMLLRVERALPNLPAPIPVVPAITSESREQRRSKLNSQFRSYLSGGPAQEHRDLLTSSDGQGGAAIPVEFSNFLSESLKWFAPLMQYANVRQSTDGRSVKVCRVDDSSHGLSLIAEGNTLSDKLRTASSPLGRRKPTRRASSAAVLLIQGKQSWSTSSLWRAVTSDPEKTHKIARWMSCWRSGRTT